jgi:hypothetical protein
MNKQYKDTDLREALRRKYADTPQLPPGFMDDMKGQMNAPMVRPVRRWWWVAAAACVLLIIGIGITMMPTGETMPTASNVVAKVESPQASVDVATSKEPKKEGTSSQKTVNKKTGKKQPAKKQKKQLRDSGKQQKTIPVSPTVSPAYTDHLHYASAEMTKDTLPYQNPARVDEFIAKMAAYNHVKQGELQCTQPAGSNVVSSVYVFPDNKEIDVFGRLLQVACWYSDETPGYLLSFSHQQFFFELKDMRQQLQYRWIAERVNGKILLYGTHAPLGTKESPACYQEYRDELMHIRSINKKTKEI